MKKIIWAIIAVVMVLLGVTVYSQRKKIFSLIKKNQETGKTFDDGTVSLDDIELEPADEALGI